jgi:hypothetical protein
MRDLSEPHSQRPFIHALAKHLPPSATNLRLLDASGQTGDVLAELRGDLAVTALPEAGWSFSDDQFDAVVACDFALTELFLDNTLAALRPGGRLVMVASDGQPDEALVERLESAGYVRILVEPAVDGEGVLLRGEKAHATADTLERIQAVAGQDAAQTELSDFKGRYVHLLIRQTPNKPVWKLKPGESIEWAAVALESNNGSDEPILLAFSSLPNAVGFMQPAVMNGSLTGINKVGKFSRETAQTWTQPVALNPPVDILSESETVFVPVDVDSAETPDE